MYQCGRCKGTEVKTNTNGAWVKVGTTLPKGAAYHCPSCGSRMAPIPSISLGTAARDSGAAPSLEAKPTPSNKSSDDDITPVVPIKALFLRPNLNAKKPTPKRKK
jgi:DNA-directed RNA polymerase subunit RPC12/RpoP